MEQKTKNPVEIIGEAQANYFKEFNEFTENYRRLYEYIKPFIDQNEEYKEIASKINTSLIALPLSHLVINTMHMAQVGIMRDVARASIPPLKIECPKCKLVVWDVSGLKDLLDPEGIIYGKKQSTK